MEVGDDKKNPTKRRTEDRKDSEAAQSLTDSQEKKRREKTERKEDFPRRSEVGGVTRA